MQLRSGVFGVRRLGLLLGIAVLGHAGCSPVLDWREVRPQGSGLQLLMPCKPVPQTRKVRVAGQALSLWLHACQAGAQTWALAHVDVGAPALVGPALSDLRASAVANIAGTETAAGPWTVPGATPHPESRRLQVRGRLPDGRTVQEHVAMFAIGTMVFQATVVGEALPEEPVNTFYESMRAAP